MKSTLALLGLKSPLLSVLSALTVCALSSTASRAEDGNKKLVRITMARSVSTIPLWGMGPFAEKHGLKVEFLATGTNADMQRNLQQGVEIGTLGYQSPAMMAEQNVSNVKVIAGVQSGGQNLIVRKGSQIKSWKDLEGKRIGTAPGTYVGILFILAAKANAVDLSKITFVNMGAAGTAGLQALKSGDLDGLVLWSPIIDRAVVDGYAIYPPCCDLGTTAEYGGGNQILAANTDFLKDRATAVTFMKAYSESLNYYVQNPEKAVNLIVQYTGVNKDDIAEAWKHGQWSTHAIVKTMVNVAKVGPTFGFTKTDMSAKVPQYVDLSYLAEATGKPINELDRLK